MIGVLPAKEIEKIDQLFWESINYERKLYEASASSNSKIVLDNERYFEYNSLMNTEIK